MRIAARGALLAVVLTATACAGGRTAEEPGPPATPSRGEPLLAFVWPDGGTGSAELAEVDPRTLETLGRPARLTVEPGVVERSPAGQVVAVADARASRIEFVDTKRMRSLGVVDLRTAGYVSRLSWPSEPGGTLFAAVGQSEVAVLHPPDDRSVEWRSAEGVFVGDVQPTRAGALALVGAADGIGPLRAVVFGGKGTVSTALGGIVGGSEIGSGEDGEPAGLNVPGLAVHPSGKRALVVPAGGRVVELDLADLDVTEHALAQKVSLRGRFAAWLDPEAHAKLIRGPVRQAVWLGSGLVAVSGADYRVSGASTEEPTAEPAGLSLIDPRDWSVRMVARDVAEFQVAGDRLVAFDPGCGDEGGRFGFVVYDSEGNEGPRVCRDAGFDPRVVGDYAYLAFDDGTRFEIVELRTGAVVARARTTRTTLLLGD